MPTSLTACPWCKGSLNGLDVLAHAATHAPSINVMANQPQYAQAHAWYLECLAEHHRRLGAAAQEGNN